MNAQRINPTAPVYGTKADEWATCDPRYPYVGTTYRVVEHWQTGVMTRHQPWLLEMQPQMFVEMSEELATAQRDQKWGTGHGHLSPRRSRSARPLSPSGFNPLRSAGADVHQVGMPWHFGWVKPVSGKEESANLLTPVHRRSQYPHSRNQSLYGQRSQDIKGGDRNE